MSLTRNDSYGSLLGSVGGDLGALIDSLKDSDSDSSHQSRKEDLNKDLGIGKGRALSPVSDQTLSRALGKALSEGSKPETENDLKGSLPLVIASDALTSTKQDSRLAKVASAENVRMSSDVQSSEAFTGQSGFQSPLTLARVSHTSTKQGLNDPLANTANTSSVNASNADALKASEHGKAFNAKPKEVPGLLMVKSKTKVKAFDVFPKRVLSAK